MATSSAPELLTCPDSRPSACPLHKKFTAGTAGLGSQLIRRQSSRRRSARRPLPVPASRELTPATSRHRHSSACGGRSTSLRQDSVPLTGSDVPCPPRAERLASGYPYLLPCAAAPLIPSRQPAFHSRFGPPRPASLCPQPYLSFHLQPLPSGLSPALRPRRPAGLSGLKGLTCAGRP
jgi:hypothetical protein